MNKLLKKIVRFMLGVNNKPINEERVFRQKVRKIMKYEIDFTPLYDYNTISKLNESEKIEYLGDITRRYLTVKSEILQNKNLKFR